MLVKLEDDWWLVRKDGLVYGMVPSNYFDSASVPASPSRSMTGLLEEENIFEDGDIKWIDTVDVRCAWPAKLVLSKNDKRKGELVVGEDGSIGFISEDKRAQLLKLDLINVISFDKKKKELAIRNSDEKIKLDLSKAHGEALQKEIGVAHKRAEDEALEWERAQMAAYASAEQETAPELPDRVSSPASPKFEQASSITSMLNQRIGSPTKSPLSANGECEGPFVTALYSYEPNEEDELKVDEDEKLRLVDDSSEDWWLVQRLTGSQRQGLVPSSYLQRARSTATSPTSRVPTPYERKFGLSPTAAPEEELNDEEKEEDGGLIQPKSPRSPGSGPVSPVMSAAFLSEIKDKIKARSPVAEEQPIISDEIDESVVDDAPVVPAALIAAPPPPPPMPAQFKTIEEEISPVNAPPHVHKQEKEELPVTRRPALPVPRVEELQVKVNLVETRKASVVEPREIDVVKAEPKKMEPTVTLPMPKLKPVVQDDKGLNALSSMLLRKQEDMKAGSDGNEVRSPPSPKPVHAVEQPARNNPWTKLSMKTIVEKEQAPKMMPASVPKPTITTASSAKPVPVETRLWTSRNGQFQVEAKYMGYQGGKVSLHKLNGTRVSVALDQLCERDKEFVYRREGIPWDQGPKRDFRVGTHDWLAFFMDSGIDPNAARRCAQSCLDKKIGETFLLSPSFNREFLLSKLSMNEADVLEVLRHTNSVRATKANDAGVRMNLEKIEMLKRDLAMKPKPVAPVERRPSEAFAQIEMPYLAHMQPAQMQQNMLQPVRAKSIKDIPAMQPAPKNGQVPTMLSSTTVISAPSQLPPNPLASYLATSPPQPQFNGQMGYAQQPQQMNQSPAMLPNLAQPRAYVPPQPQPTQQRVYQVQTGGPMQYQQYPVLNTTQVRTEYYGTQQPQQMPQMPQMQYAPMMAQQQPMMQSHQQNPQYQQQQQYQYAQQGYANPQQAALAGLQNLHLQAPATGPKAAAGDKYSIFRYVDPAAPQVLPQPGSDPNTYGYQSHQQRP